MTLEKIIDNNFKTVKLSDVICEQCIFVNGKETKTPFKMSFFLENCPVTLRIIIKENISMLKQ